MNLKKKKIFLLLSKNNFFSKLKLYLLIILKLQKVKIIFFKI